MRTFLAIVLGYLVFAISAVALFQIARVDPHVQPGAGFMIGSTLYGVCFAAAGGYIASRVAAKKELLNACAVAGVIAVLAAVSIVAQPGIPSHWSQIAAIVLMAPSAVFGCWLRIRKKKSNANIP